VYFFLIAQDFKFIIREEIWKIFEILKKIEIWNFLHVLGWYFICRRQRNEISGSTIGGKSSQVFCPVANQHNGTIYQLNNFTTNKIRLMLLFFEIFYCLLTSIEMIMTLFRKKKLFSNLFIEKIKNKSF